MVKKFPNKKELDRLQKEKDLKKKQIRTAKGPALPKETSGGGSKGSGKPTNSPKLPGERLARKWPSTEVNA